MGWWHGEEWRWDPRSHDAPRALGPSITVLEESKDARDERGKRPGRRVPFGFIRELQQEPEPLTWEGD